MIRPITPSDIQSTGSLYEQAVKLINEALTNKRWHDMYTEHQRIRDNYYAIILYPAGELNPVMDLVVEDYKDAGWDCFWQRAYDARGPHHCFYVSKKHFQ
jgi:hypothetical protein